MTPFITSNYCTSGLYCAVCRQPDSRFRRRMSELFSVPGHSVNFECPLGKPWSGQPQGTNDHAAVPDCVPHAAWCERYGLPTAEHACEVCAESRADNDGGAWFAAQMRAIGYYYGALPCEHREDTGRTETVRCCGGKTKEVTVYRCAMSGVDPAPCARCRDKWS